MFYTRYLIYFIQLQLILAVPQLNLYYTDWISEIESDNDNDLQHDCLRIGFFDSVYVKKLEMISYCLSELPSKFNFLSKFTFLELSRQNISSEQLCIWSAPINLIERYQFYLNRLI
jgi:hypothetical protein